MEERDLDESVIDDIDRGLFKVHRRAFVDPAVFALESERIFSKTWLYVAYEAELKNPGDFVTRRIAGRSVIVVRDDDGSIRVLLNRCSHRGALLTLEPQGCAKFFRCPYHAWTYSRRGELTGVPGIESYGPEWDKDAMGLLVIPRVASYRGFVFVSFDANAEPLDEFLGEARTIIDLTADQPENGWEIVRGRNKYTIRANWKLIVESYTDNYHVTMLHDRYLQHYRELGMAVPPNNQWLQHKGAISHGRGLGRGHCFSENQQFAALGRLAGSWGPNLPEWSKAEIERRRRSLEERLGPERAYRIATTVRNMRIFPTLHLIDQISAVIRVATPHAANQCDIEEFVLAPRGESDELRALRLKNLIIQHGGTSFLSTDDIEMLERTQLGLESPGMDWVDYARGFKIGRTLSVDEQQMRELYRYWHEMITLGRVEHRVRS